MGGGFVLKDDCVLKEMFPSDVFFTKYCGVRQIAINLWCGGKEEWMVLLGGG